MAPVSIRQLLLQPRLLQIFLKKDGAVAAVAVAGEIVTDEAHIRGQGAVVQVSRGAHIAGLHPLQQLPSLGGGGLVLAHSQMPFACEAAAVARGAEAAAQEEGGIGQLMGGAAVLIDVGAHARDAGIQARMQGGAGRGAYGGGGVGIAEAEALGSQGVHGRGMAGGVGIEIMHGIQPVLVRHDEDHIVFHGIPHFLCQISVRSRAAMA